MRNIFLNRRNVIMPRGAASAGSTALAFAFLALFVRLVAPDFFLAALAPELRLVRVFSARAHTVAAAFSGATALAARNDALTAENELLANENRALADEIASLSGLGIAPGRGIVASVLARPPVAAYGTLILSAGSEQGVAPGMEVFGNGGVPLGVIKTVTERFSRVALFSAPGATLAAWAGATHVPILLIGAGAGAFSASAPRSANFSEGETIFAPGEPAAPIGVIERIDGAAAAPIVSLAIAPAANPFTLTMVVVRDVGGALSGAFACTAPSKP